MVGLVAQVKDQGEMLGIRKSLEGLPIPGKAELQETYFLEGDGEKLYLMEISGLEKAEKLFNLYVKKFTRARQAEESRVELDGEELKLLHRDICCGGDYHSTAFQWDRYIFLLRGQESRREAEKKLKELWRL